MPRSLVPKQPLYGTQASAVTLIDRLSSLDAFNALAKLLSTRVADQSIYATGSIDIIMAAPEEDRILLEAIFLGLYSFYRRQPGGYTYTPLTQGDIDRQADLLDELLTSLVMELVAQRPSLHVAAAAVWARLAVLPDDKARQVMQYGVVLSGICPYIEFHPPQDLAKKYGELRARHPAVIRAIGSICLGRHDPLEIGVIFNEDLLERLDLSREDKGLLIGAFIGLYGELRQGRMMATGLGQRPHFGAYNQFSGLVPH